MRLIDLNNNEQLAMGNGEVFWPDTRGAVDPFLTITIDHYKLFIESGEELNELFYAFSPQPEEKYLDL